MKISQVQRTLPTLFVSDRNVLKTVGLAALAKQFDAYPVPSNGQNYIFLLPTSLSPQQLAKRSVPELAKSVIVLAQETGKWARVPVEIDVETPAPEPEPEREPGLQIEYEE